MKTTKVTEIMQRDPVSARPEMTLPKLVALMREHGLRGLPVTDGESRLEGVVTESDLFLKPKGLPFSMIKVPSLLGEVVDVDDADRSERAHRVTVGELMTRNVTTIDEEATVPQAAFLMYERRLTLLPVVRGDELVGVVRRYHVLRRIYGEG